MQTFTICAMTLQSDNPNSGPHVSIGIIAWNEEQAISAALESLFEQSFLSELGQRGRTCEIICIANGCTDCTAEVAEAHFARQSREHPFSHAFSCRVVPVEERGKINAWNMFVHALSAPEARYLFLMDADIVVHGRDTFWNMLLALENDADASVSVDLPRKDIDFKGRKTFMERLSLGASQVTRASEAQLCGQLYCIRAEVARNIYLPRDLAACEDGFIKALVCTDFLAHEVRPKRIKLADNAEHTFEAYTSPAAILRNQKRQMIGQTIVHVLVDDYLRTLPESMRARLADTLREKDKAEPTWLKQLIGDHVRRTRFFWRLYPNLLSHRFRRLTKVNLWRKIACFPATAAGAAVSLVSCFMAYEFLKAGYTQYWPKAKRTGIGRAWTRQSGALLGRMNQNPK